MAKSKKISIELDSKTALTLATLAHQGIVTSNAYLAKSNPSAKDLATATNKVKIHMDTPTAEELSKKINEQLMTSSAYLAKK